MPENLPPEPAPAPPSEPGREAVTPPKGEARSSASTVAAGILSSRVVGLVREQVLAYFLGVSAYVDVFQAAVKVPNLLQNLLGEGTLSAAFIPIYSRLLEEGREVEAGRFAGAVFGLLVAVVAAATLAGIFLARPITAVVATGFLFDEGGAGAVDRFELTVWAVRIAFPAAAVLVLSAWALGVLNSHRRFFLPYAAPVLFNLAVIGGLVAAAFAYGGDPFGMSQEAPFGDAFQRRLLTGALVGTVGGGVLQFAIQLPLVAHVMRGFRLSLSTRVEGVREALRAFGPVVLGRGVYQLSAYLDIFLASWLAAGAVGVLRYAQLLYVLPVSLFGLSIAASELPELSRLSGETMRTFLRRLDKSMSQMLFLIVPTVIGYFAFGFLIVSTLFRRGSFGLSDTWLVYAVLGGYSLGLMATAASRLLQNSFYALGDTATPAKIAVARVAVSTLVAVPLMLVLDRYAVGGLLGFEPEGTPLYLGAAGLALGASAGAWVELAGLLRALHRRNVSFRLPWARTCAMAALALAALLPAALLWWALAGWPVIPTAVLVVGAYGLVYLAVAWKLGFSEINAWLGRYLHPAS